jgi:hypothetical protein
MMNNDATPDPRPRPPARARSSRAELAWRATVDQRLEGVEDAIADLRTRVNSVLALIGAAVIGQVALRFFGHYLIHPPAHLFEIGGFAPAPPFALSPLMGERARAEGAPQEHQGVGRPARSGASS